MPTQSSPPTLADHCTSQWTILELVAGHTGLTAVMIGLNLQHYMVETGG